MKRLRALILAAALAAPAALPAAAPAAVPADFVGIVSQDTFVGDAGYRNSSFAAQKALGIGIIRQTFSWAQVEVAPNSYDFTPYDSFVATAALHGIKVLPILFDPPPFRSSRPARGAKPGTYFPKDYDDFGAFGAAVAQRYGPDGIFWKSNPQLPKLPITSYQVWNEPNLAVYSPPKPSAAKYVQLLKATGPMIKAVDPNAEIVVAGLPDSKMSQPRIYKFIEQMYKAGAKGSFDTIGINPYARTSKGMLRKLKKVRRIMGRFGDGAADLWVTEVGWSDKGPGSPFRAGRKGQGRRISQMIKALDRKQASLRLRGFFYYAWKDGKPYPPRFVDFWGLHTGLIKTNGKRKPAYKAFKRAVARL